MKAPKYLSKAPIEEYEIKGKKITVYRGDLVPQPPLAPYLKMVELYPLLETLSKRGVKVVGYYAIPESEWVEALPPLAEYFGIKTIIGVADRKRGLPEYILRMDPKCIFKMRPNMYNICFWSTKKYVESHLGGQMMPMGLACPEVVLGMAKFLDSSPLPKVDNYVVPTGSGVALSGILTHLNGRHTNIWSVTTRPTKSVKAVIRTYTTKEQREYLVLDRREADYKKPEGSEFPMHPYWDANAYSWMVENFGRFKGSICFVNLGSGVKKGD